MYVDKLFFIKSTIIVDVSFFINFYEQNYGDNEREIIKNIELRLNVYTIAFDCFNQQTFISKISFCRIYQYKMF